MTAGVYYVDYTVDASFITTNRINSSFGISVNSKTEQSTTYALSVGTDTVNNAALTLRGSAILPLNANDTIQLVNLDSSTTGNAITGPPILIWSVLPTAAPPW